MLQKESTLLDINFLTHLLSKYSSYFETNSPIPSHAYTKMCLVKEVTKLFYLFTYLFLQLFTKHNIPQFRK